MTAGNVAAAVVSVGSAVVVFVGWLAWLGRRAVSPSSADEPVRPVPPRLSAASPRQGAARGWSK